MKLTPQKISIDWYRGKREISALVCGQLAIHRYEFASEITWRVTHIPTGLAIRTNLKTKREAVEILERVMPLADWDFSDPAVPRTWPKSRMRKIGAALGGTFRAAKWAPSGWSLTPSPEESK